MALKQVISYFQTRKREKALAREIYQACVAQARKPQLYESFGLTDNVQMRFEFITAHLWLVMRRLRRQGKRYLVKEMAGIFFADIDASLREAGEGDLAVPKRMKTFAQAFYGRLAAYDRAQEKNILSEALANNLPQNEALGVYFAQQIEHLESLPLSADYQDLNLFNQKGL
jgi:cytochrome b pre-mRNA-processing protein 3